MFGYLDAGSGSMIVGAVAAGAAGVGVAVRSGLMRFRKGGKSTTEPTEEAQTEDELVEADDEG